MEIIRIVAKDNLRQNTYLVVSKDASILIDCGITVEELEKALNKYNISKEDFHLDAIFLTHTHYDHTRGLGEFERRFHPTIFVSPNGEKVIDNPLYNECAFGDFILDYRPQNLKVLKDETSIKIKDLEITPYFTPGHSICSSVFKIEDHLFTGDTIFSDSVGRTDLHGGNYFDLISSIQKIKRLDTQICHPGHGVPFYFHEFNFDYFLN